MNETSAWSDFKDPASLEPDKLSTLDVPVSLIYGSRSPYLVSCDALTRLLPDMKLNTVDGAGHYFPILYPEILPDMLLGDPRNIDTEDKLVRSVI